MLYVWSQTFQSSTKEYQNLWSRLTRRLHRPTLSFIMDNMVPKNKETSKELVRKTDILGNQALQTYTYRKSIRSIISDARAGTDGCAVFPNTSTTAPSSRERVCKEYQNLGYVSMQLYKVR